MANPYSQAHNFNQVPLYQNQFDLLAVGLQAKEQGLAQGRDKVQQAYDQYANLDIYKDVDKQYAQDRLAEIMSYTDKYSGMDLSNPDLANSITKNMSQVLDENVVNAIASTKLFKAEQAEWEEKKTKEPKLYSEGNRRYAMQFSEEWRNSDQVGATYKGGGGFREFIDVEGYMTENLPKIAKDLGMTYIETTPGNGIFREDVTKEVVPRWRVQQALEGALNPKMKEQLQINAWNTYNDVPEDAIKLAYTQEYEKDLNFYQDQKDKYEALRNTTTDPRQREIYEQQINQFEQGITNLNQSSYDRVGKVGAYSSLYMKEWKDNYLDAYSHDPIEVKKDVNALDEATANYKMKVAEFNLSQEKFAYQKSQDEIKNDLAQQRIEVQKANLALKAQGKGLQKNEGPSISSITNPLGEILNVVKNSPMEDKEGEYGLSEVEWLKNQEKNAYSKFTSYYKDKISQEDMASPELITVLKNGGNGKDKVTVNLKSGKKVTINFADKYVNTLVQNYADLVLDDAPVQKKAYISVNDQASRITDKLVNTAKTDGFGGTQDQLPILKYKITGTEDNFKIVPVNFEKAGRNDFNNYASLLYKKSAGKKLTWAEEKTLDLYVKTSMYNSSSTSSDAKEVIRKSIEKDYLWKSKTKKSFSDFNSGLYTPITGDVSQANRQTLTRKNNNNQKPFEADIKNAWSLYDINNFTTKDVSSQTGLDQDLEALSSNIEAEFKSARGITNYNQTKRVTVIDQKSNPETWKKADQLFPGKLEKDYEVNIVPNTWANGLPKGTSKLVITDKNGDLVDKGSIELSPEQLKEFTGKTLQITRDAFDARFGEFAQSANLGNGSVKALQNKDGVIEMSDIDRYNRLQVGDENMYIGSNGAAVPYFSQDFFKQGYRDFAEVGQGDLFLKEARNLEDNQLYKFKFEPVDGQYAVTVYKDNKQVYAKPTGLVSLNSDELLEMKMRSQVLSRQAWFDYVKALALTQSADYPTGN